MQNHLKALYEGVTLDDLSAKVAELTRPAGLAWPGTVDVIYQSIEGLRAAMPRVHGGLVLHR